MFKRIIEIKEYNNIILSSVPLLKENLTTKKSRSSVLPGNIDDAYICTYSTHMLNTVVGKALDFEEDMYVYYYHISTRQDYPRIFFEIDDIHSYRKFREITMATYFDSLAYANFVEDEITESDREFLGETAYQYLYAFRPDLRDQIDINLYDINISQCIVEVFEEDPEHFRNLMLKNKDGVYDLLYNYRLLIDLPGCQDIILSCLKRFDSKGYFNDAVRLFRNRPDFREKILDNIPQKFMAYFLKEVKSKIDFDVYLVKKITSEVGIRGYISNCTYDDEMVKRLCKKIFVNKDIYKRLSTNGRDLYVDSFILKSGYVDEITSRWTNFLFYLDRLHPKEYSIIVNEGVMDEFVSSTFNKNFDQVMTLGLNRRIKSKVSKHSMFQMTDKHYRDDLVKSLFKAANKCNSKTYSTFIKSYAKVRKRYDFNVTDNIFNIDMLGDVPDEYVKLRTLNMELMLTNKS